MALLSSCDISELCLGKPLLKPLPVSSSIRETLSALRRCCGGGSETHLSVWNRERNRCIGRISTVDVICYLCTTKGVLEGEEGRGLSALDHPVSVLLQHLPEGLVRHVEPSTSLLEALYLITVEGAQNLVVPVGYYSSSNSKKKKQQLKSTSYGCNASLLGYCWLTQEDVLRFLFNYIGLLSPLPALSLNSLGLIRDDILTVEYHMPASSALSAIALAYTQQTSVAVVSPHGKLVGEISPSTLAACNETIVPAITTLSAGDLVAYIDGRGPPRELLEAVKTMLMERGDMDGMLELLEDGDSCCSCSSDEELSSSSSLLSSLSLRGPLRQASLSIRNNRRWGSSSYSARMVQSAEEAIVCHGESSLVAVMVQALAHRVNYVWVIETDYTMAGIVTITDILNVFREHLLASE